MDFANAPGLVTAAVNSSNNSEENVFEGITAYNVPATIPVIRFRDNNNRNYARFDFVEKVSASNLVTFDANTTDNYVEFVKQYPLEVQLDSLVTNNGDSTNKIASVQLSNRTIKQYSSNDAIRVINVESNVVLNSNHSFVLEDADKPVIVQLGSDQITGISGFAIGDINTANRADFTYNLTSEYWQLSTGYRAYTSTFRPTDDGVKDLGLASNRWDTVYAVTGTINTSDETEKTELLDLGDAELACALECKKLIKKFKFKESIKAKGDDARTHIGVGAQAIVECFNSHSLDPFEYGIVCLDTWELEGETKKRYGIRYDQLTLFILAAM